MHSRNIPVKHAFTYPVYFFLLDLNELPDISHTARLFGHNTLNVYSIRDRDYLTGEGTIRQKLMRLLSENGFEGQVSKIELLTAARYCHYVFNPVSFYYCRDKTDRLICVCAEVNNTFGEKHLYILDTPEPDRQTEPYRFTRTKVFHVSPFNNMSGEYRFTFSEPGDSVRISIALHRDDNLVMTAVLSGKAKPLTTTALLESMLRFPLAAALTMPRILFQAGRLYFQKKLPVYTKPVPVSPMTIRRLPPTRFQQVSRQLVFKVFSGISHGRLKLVLPDGSVSVFGCSGEEITLRILDHRFFSRLVLSGDTGLGESYTAGEWDTPDLTCLIMFLIDNLDALTRARGFMGKAGDPLNRLLHALRDNTRRGSRNNIRAHYDLGNDLYELFLDENLMYSCGLFLSPDDSLEQAQINKIARILEYARIEPDHHVLEIGSGWGGFALETVKQTGCRITSVTLSEEQQRLAVKRIRDAGLEDRVDILLADYRDVKGQFDRIVSIEMLEAVGHRHFKTFFSACEQLLKPDGVMVLQSITIPDHRYEHYRRHPDWIQKYIFPGGILPSVAVLGSAMAVSSRFHIDRLENIGLHYALTLKHWKERFERTAETLLSMGYDRAFQRMWRYYLSYCEAGFRKKIINDVIMVLTRQGNQSYHP